MDYHNLRINVKVFQIDRTHYELRGLNFGNAIEAIKENHKKALRAKFENIPYVKPNLVYSDDGEFEYASYCYNQPKDQYYWKLFLPESIIENQKFEIFEFSYVLFIHYMENIYCVIGGAGMTVIKKYVNPSFGIEIYQHIANPKEDIVIEMSSRGVASNISRKKHTYNLNQTISETLDYSEVPTKIKLIIREELKESVFKNFNLEHDRSIMEVGSYFNLLKRISFTSLLGLIKQLHNVTVARPSVPITLFNKVNKSDLITNLDNTLKSKIVDGIIAVDRPNNSPIQEDIIEVVHPYKLERFYECDKYIVRSKFSRGKDDVEVNDRSELYESCIAHIHSTADNLTDRYQLRGELYKLRITGCIGSKKVTSGNFYEHVVAEINYDDRKYFRIDGQWFHVKDEFIQLMTQDAVVYYEKYKLRDDILKKWNRGLNEENYNLSHTSEFSYVLDRRYRDNIELCDILVEKDGNLFLVHVKDGFGTRLRECYIQIVLSAKRLSVDLRENGGNGFLRRTLQYYNSFNKDHLIDVDDVINKLENKRLTIVYVMAYCNRAYVGSSDVDKIRRSKSNIAKYSIVQIVKEMRAFFDVQLIDISSLS